MKLILLFFIPIFAASGLITAQQKPSSCVILFGKNSHTLSPSTITRLDSLITSINEGDQIEITGYTDSDAGETFNSTLSGRRARVVTNYLTSKGISNKVRLTAKGEREPLNTNSNEFEKSLNRRVEIVRFDSHYNDVFDTFKKQYQVFMINPARDTLLRCAEGLELRFGAGVLKGARSGPVIIKVQEFYAKSEFVLAGLTTDGPGNAILESGGMVNIEAWQSGKKLDVKQGQQVGVIFKNRQPTDNMQLFNGSGSNGSMAWLQAVADLTTTSQANHIPAKEMMTVRYSVYDTSYVYSHYVEKGSQKITKNTIKGKTTIDTVNDGRMTRTDMMFGTTRLGWINCDRFYNTAAPKVDVSVIYNKSITPFVSLVFKDMNSILPCTVQTSDRVLFKNIPQDKEIIVIGIYKSKNSDRMLFAMKKATSGDGLLVKLDFEELSADEVKEKLKQL